MLLFEELFRSIFTVDGGPAAGIVKKALPAVSEAGVSALARDLIQIVTAL